MAGDMVGEPLQAFRIAPHHQQVWTGRVCHMRSATRKASLTREGLVGPSGFHILGFPLPGSRQGFRNQYLLARSQPLYRGYPTDIRIIRSKEVLFQWEASGLGRSHWLRASLLWLSLIIVRMRMRAWPAPAPRPSPPHGLR